MKQSIYHGYLWLAQVVLISLMAAQSLYAEQVRVKLYPDHRIVTGELKEFVFDSHLTMQTTDSLLTYRILDMRNIRILSSEQSYLTASKNDFDVYQDRTTATGFNFEPSAGISYGKIACPQIGTKSGMGYAIGGFSATELTPNMILQTNLLISSLSFTYLSGNEPVADRQISSGAETHISLVMPASIRYRIPILPSGWELYPGIGIGLSIPFYARQNLSLVGNATRQQTFMITDNLQTANLHLNVALALHTGAIGIDVRYLQAMSDVYVHPAGCRYQSVELLLRINRLKNLLSTAL